MFVLRSARPDDLGDLLQLASHFDTVNLPADEDALVEIIASSCAAFARPEGREPGGSYLFVMEDVASARLIGTSMILAAHGTPEDPHSYFQVEREERYSATLQRLFQHETLTFKQSFTPHTEIGGLILDPAWRGHSRRLGIALSFVRFFYMGLHRERFHDRVQAELLPPFEPDGTSRLWEWIGRRFTGLDYPVADRLSRDSREFMTSLFPRTPLYISLMPESVREVIGRSGEGTRGAERMLRSIGFRYNYHVDPFDGGPHFEARTEDVSLFREIRRDVPVVTEKTLDAAARAGAARRMRQLVALPVRPDDPPGTFRAVDVDGWWDPSDGQRMVLDIDPEVLHNDGRTTQLHADLIVFSKRDRRRALEREKEL